MAYTPNRPAPAHSPWVRGWLRSRWTGIALHVLPAASVAAASHTLTSATGHFHTVLAPYLTATAAAAGLGAGSLLAWWCWLVTTPPGIVERPRSWLWPLAATALMYLGILGWGFSWFLAATAGC